MPRRVAIVGGGVAGLGTAWALHRHPERFDFRVFEAEAHLGGNAVTADMPQDDGTSIPFDISVTACIPSVYHHIRLVARQLGVELVDTRFSYSVGYRGGIYAHDLDCNIGRELRTEIEQFQRLLKRLHRFGRLNGSRSRLLNALNPFNYVSMGTVLNFGRYSGDFRYKVLKPMFVNFLMATNVFDMPASLFSRYLEFFDIVTATPMQNHLHHAQPAAVGESIRQALPGDLQPDQPHRRRQGRQEVVVSARRTRCPPHRCPGPLVPNDSGQETDLALRGAHAGEQPGDLFRVRPGDGKAARGGLSIPGPRITEVVQLLRAHDVRVALPQRAVSQRRRRRLRNRMGVVAHVRYA